MATMRSRDLDLAAGTATEAAAAVPQQAKGSEWNASPLRPVAHWVRMPTSGGRSRLEMVWEVPDPIAP
jgi:hypothetical protein